ncbi:hypothetical protein BDN67DRAFT_1016756 [Paxillus ammoniavirescens]|nr:hypothetical protein BDN67DRAFT_1016756 [Paxillus ammoniavirescens]
MLQGFPPIKLSRYILPANTAHGGVIANPFVVTDIKDCVILWFLPGVFTAGRQDAIRKATDCLKSTLSKPKQATGWRTDARYYTSDADGGILNVLPAWHAQAHKSADDLEWLRDSETSFKLINALLTTIHPELYRCSSTVRKQLLANEEIADLHELIKAWPTVFTAISVVHTGKLLSIVIPNQHPSGMISS